jgi:hypothetical protein
MSILEALVATVAALLRIFIGSLWFAVWGTYSLVAVTRIHSISLRVLASMPLIALFAVVLAGLMLGISAAGRRLLRAS